MCGPMTLVVRGGWVGSALWVGDRWVGRGGFRWVRVVGWVG